MKLLKEIAAIVAVLLIGAGIAIATVGYTNAKVGISVYVSTEK